MGTPEPLLVPFLVLSAAVLIVSSIKVIYIPLALWFEVRRGTFLGGMRSLRAGPTAGPRHGAGSRAHRYFRQQDWGDVKVSVIVPAYNEALVLRACVESILTSVHPHLEIIIVDDGSTDDTVKIMSALASEHEQVLAVRQENAGKGAALNRGMSYARGSVFIFVDADGIFTPLTISWLLTGLRDPKVGAVCGDDRPVNLDRLQTRLLSVISHVGTGVARRALSVLRCLPIVSGNIGAFRADLVREIGGFRTDTVGEDLELTWRVYEAGYRVTFEPRAIVLAESPSTIRALWRQRVRWSRGLLQTIRHHRAMVGNPRYGVFGIFLIFNAVSMIIIPVLQIFVLGALAFLLPAGLVTVDRDAVGFAGWLGLIVTVQLAVFGIVLNAAWRDLRNLWTVPLLPFYSVFMSAAMLSALSLELRGAPARWNKLQRTGVVTQGAVRGIVGRQEA